MKAMLIGKEPAAALGYEYVEDEPYDAVVIGSLTLGQLLAFREERVLADDAGGLLRLQRSEGERVSAGGTVALVYADQTSLDRQQEIDELTSRIDQLQFAQEASVGSEVLLKLDTQIMRSLLAYRSELAAGRLDNAEEHETELKSLVLKRDYTYSDTEDLSGQIAELQSQLKELKAQAASSVRAVKAPVSGVYSAVVDGYETVLTPGLLADMTPSQLNALQADETLTSQTGKLILGDNWYYAVTMSADQAKALRDSGGTMTLRFAKGVEQDQTVTLYAVGPEEQGRVVVTFRGEYNMAQVTLLRRQSGQLIWRTVAGIRVPNEALRAANTKVDQEGNRTTVESLGVYCVVGMEARFKPVEVLYSGDGFVLVRSTAASDQESLRLRPGDEIIISAKDLYDGKVVG